MKKKILIIIGVILLAAAILVVPVPSAKYDDGGTRVFTSLTYKMVKWNRIYSDDICYNSTRFYFGEDKNKSIDELWQEINPEKENADVQTTEEESTQEQVTFQTQPAEDKTQGRSEYQVTSHTQPPETKENECILIEHDGVKVYMSKEDSDYIKSVIDGFQFSAQAFFSGEKDYIIYYNSVLFGGDEIYYDVSTSEDDAYMNQIGNTSIRSIPMEEKAKFDSTLAGYFNGERQGATIKSTN